MHFQSLTFIHCKALNGLICAEVPLRNYSLTPHGLAQSYLSDECQPPAGVWRQSLITRHMTLGCVWNKTHLGDRS